MKFYATLMAIALSRGQIAELSATEDYLVCSRDFCLPKMYDKIQLPPTENNEALKVGTEFSIVQLTSVDDKNFEVKMVMYFRISWDEPRLIYMGNVSDVPKLVTAGLDITNYMWMPDIFMYNLKSKTRLKVVRDLASERGIIHILERRHLFRFIILSYLALFIQNGKRMRYSMQLHVGFWCRMRFEKFPFDQQVQICSLASVLSQFQSLIALIFSTVCLK